MENKRIQTFKTRNPTKRNDNTFDARFKRSSRKYESEYRYLDRERERMEIPGLRNLRNGLREGIEHRYEEGRRIETRDHEFSGRKQYIDRDRDQPRRNKKYGIFKRDLKSGNDPYETDRSFHLMEIPRKKYGSVRRK